MKNVTILVSLFLAVVVMVSSAKGVILVGDDFNYPDGQLADMGNAGGISLDANNTWTGPWRDGSDNPAQCRSQTNPFLGSVCYACSGGQMEIITRPITIDDPGLYVGGLAIQGIERPFKTDLAPGTTAYFGLSLKRAAAGAGIIFGMYLDEPGIEPDGQSPLPNGSPLNLNILLIGSNPPVENSTLHANVVTGGISGPAGSVTDGVFHRVVAKLEFDAGTTPTAEKLTVWLDPTAEADAPVIVKQDQDLGTNNSLNGALGNGMALGIYARDVFASPLFAMDNLVLTTDFASALAGLAPPSVDGDYNDNGTVDAADYVLWRDGGPLQNEVDMPGIVTPADYTEWRSRFGNVSGSGSAIGVNAVVPEPTAWLLALLGCLATLASRPPTFRSARSAR